MLSQFLEVIRRFLTMSAELKLCSTSAMIVLASWNPAIGDSLAAGTLPSPRDGSVASTDFWLSPVGVIGGGAAQPATATDIPTVNHSISDTKGELYLWGRPDSDAEISGWSLRAVAMGSVIAFSNSDVDTFNPVLNMSTGAKRWDNIAQPNGTSNETQTTSGDVQGFNIGLTGGGRVAGLGISSGVSGADSLYDPAINAWLLAKISYTLPNGAPGATDVSLQIGNNGIKTVGNPISAVDVRLGAATDPVLSGDMIYTSSVTAEATVMVTGGQLQLPCDYVNIGDGCDIADLDALYEGTHGAPPLSDTAISTWLTQASVVTNPKKRQTSDVYVFGDADLDGQVNSSDLGLLLNQFGNSGSIGWGQGNLNSNSTVDSSDLGLLLNQFGFSSASATSSVVPEPNFMLQIVLITMLPFRRMR